MYPPHKLPFKMSFPILFVFWASSSSLPRSLHSGAQHQSVGAAVRPIALIKSSTITGSLFKIPNPGLPPRWICLSRPHNLHFMRRCSTSSTTPHSGDILSVLPSAGPTGVFPVFSWFMLGMLLEFASSGAMHA